MELTGRLHGGELEGGFTMGEDELEGGFTMGEDELEGGFTMGEDAALRRVYEAYGTLIHTFCRRLLPAGRAADATEETFVSAWHHRTAFDAARKSLAGWLLSIARSTVLDEAADIDDDELDRVAERLLIAQCLSQLPERPQRILEAVFYGDLTHTEIAEQTRVPLDTVKSDIQAGLEHIRRELETYDDAH